MTGVVLHVLEAIEGGTSRYLMDVVWHVHEVAHHVALPTRRRGGATDPNLHQALRAAGAVLHPLDMDRTPVRGVNARALVELRRLLRQLRPGVVHGHSSIGGALARVAAMGAGVPTIYTPQGLAPGATSRRIERALGRVTSRFIAASPSEADLVRRLRLVASDRIVVIPNGIDVTAPVGAPDRDLRQELGVPPRAPLIGTISRLVPQKAPEVFLAACAQVAQVRHDAHFLLIGSGPLQATVEREVARHGLAGRFHQIRHAPSAALLLPDLDVFVLASRFEGAPYAPLEAMRAGRPVVLTDVIGSRDTVEDGVSGLLVPADDPAALGRAVLTLLTDPERASAMGRAGRSRLRELFDVRAMGAAHREVYRDVGF